MNVLITGASSGIGEELALAAAKRGDRLFLCGRDKARLEQVGERCKAAGAAEVSCETVDVTQAATTRDFIERADEIAPLDYVFANAGVSTGQETECNVRNTFQVNMMGTVNTVLPAIDLMGERGNGHIVLTASIAGYGPLAACPSYSATKAGVKTWGLSLRGHLRPKGVKVSVVCPGFVRSRITDQNTCPMPFFMEADKAAAIIWKGVMRNKALIAFPWPMRLAVWFLSAMPFAVNEFVNRFLPRKN